jgi:hypothetical protein
MDGFTLILLALAITGGTVMAVLLGRRLARLEAAFSEVSSSTDEQAETSGRVS